MEPEKYYIESYNFNGNTNYEYITSVYEKLYDYLYNKYTNEKDYLLIDYESMFNDYLLNITNYFYFFKIEESLILQLNNKLYTTGFNKLYKFMEAPIYNLFNYYVNASKYMSSQNIKKVLSNFDNVYYKNHIHFYKGPVKIITHKNIDYEPEIKKSKIYFFINKYTTPYLEDEKDLLHCAYVGMMIMNNIKYYLPNIIYTFMYTKCSRPNILEDKVINWCNLENKDYFNFPYLYVENIEGMDFNEFLNTCNDIELSYICIQYKNILTFLSHYLNEYINRNHDMGQFRIVKLTKEIDIPLYDIKKSFFSTKLIQENYITTNLILYLTDFTDTTISYITKDGENIYGNDIVRLENHKSKNKNFDYESFIKKINKNVDINLVQLKKGEIKKYDHYKVKYINKLNYNYLCLTDKYEIKENLFLDFLIEEINKFEIIKLETLSNYLFLSKIQDFINFLNYLNGCLCFNFIFYMDKIINLYVNFTSELSKRLDINFLIKDSLYKTLNTNLDKLPTKNMITKHNSLSGYFIVQNFITRILFYKMLIAILLDLYYDNTGLSILFNMTPLLVNQPKISIVTNIFKTVTLFLTRNVFLNFLSSHYVFLIFLLIQLYPQLLNFSDNLWNMTYNIYDNMLLCKMEKQIQKLYELDKKSVDDESWNFAKEEIKEYEDNNSLLEYSKNINDNSFNQIIKEILNKLRNDKGRKEIEFILKSNLSDEEKKSKIDIIFNNLKIQ